jgi:glycosyltransferase involved in cell wall biosynthesis
MKILLLAQFYPPITGGIERHVQSLGAGLASRGHDVSVATLWHQGLPEFEMDGAVRVHRIRGSLQRLTSLFTVDRQHAPPFPDPEAVAALRKLILVEKPDIVHAHNWLIHSFLPIKKWSKARLVMTLHDSELVCVQMRMMHMDKDLCSGPGFFKCMNCSMHHYGKVKGLVTFKGNWLMSGVERNAVDLFLPVSTAIAKSNKLEGSKSRYTVTPNFVPDDVADVSDELDPRVAALPENGFILQVGDLSRDKGVEVLIEAYRGLKSAPPLVLIGRRLPESPKELPEGVTVIDGMPHNAVMQAWKRSMFGTAPSICLDACPTVTLEAMSAGKPVIGARIGGIVDQIVEGETGLLVQPGSVEELRQAMARLIADPVLRSRMGESAKRKVVEYQAGAVIDRIKKSYLELMK